MYTFLDKDGEDLWMTIGNLYINMQIILRFFHRQSSGKNQGDRCGVLQLVVAGVNPNSIRFYVYEYNWNRQS